MNLYLGKAIVVLINIVIICLLTEILARAYATRGWKNHDLLLVLGILMQIFNILLMVVA
jgi:hypothetical protein